MQTKLQPDIRIAIRQYLMILDYVDVNVNAKVNEKVDINKVELNKSKL